MAATENEKIPVYGTLITGVPDGQVVDTDNIRDPNMENMTQSQINAQQASKKPYLTFPTYADFPLVGVPDTIYISENNKFEWEYKVGTGYSLLTDNWRSLVAIHGNID